MKLNTILASTAAFASIAPTQATNRTNGTGFMALIEMKTNATLDGNT